MATTALFQEKENLETYSLIWLDASVNSSDENVAAQKKLRTAINYLKTFDDDHQCEEYIRLVPKGDRIVLIVSGRLGETFVPRIHHFQQVFSIYMYCMNQEKNERWAGEFVKVKAVITRLSVLIKRIRSDQVQRSHNKIDEALAISVFSTSSAATGQSTSGINGQFLHSQLLIDCLVQMKSTSNDRVDLLSFCRKQYEGNDEQLDILQEFEDHYVPSDAVRWYTRQSFLYRLLNKALRDQTIDLLFYFRFFIRDIGQQLDQNKCTTPMDLYRGQLMSKEEIQMLKKNVGEFISINSFLSTSLDPELALSFLDESNAFERVFFEVHADPGLENVKPFSDITSFSYFSDEREILFMVGTIFHLNHVEQNSNGIWTVKMTLCASDDHQLQSLLEHLKIEDEEGEKNLLSFSKVLTKMGRLDDGEKYCLLFLDTLAPDSKETVRCYLWLGRIATAKDDLDSSLNWLNRALQITQRNGSSNDAEAARIYHRMGQAYRKKNEPDLALQTTEKALVIWKKTLGSHSLGVADCYTVMGAVYIRKQEYLKALHYFKKARKIKEKHLPEYHCILGSAHIDIASAYRHLRDFDLSLQHASFALEIFEKSFPSDHSNFGWVYETIGLVFEQQHKPKESLSYLEKALHIYQQGLPPDLYYIADVKRNIQRASSGTETASPF